MLAVMDVCVSSPLLFHKDGSRIAGKTKFGDLIEVRRNWSSAVVPTLAIVTILGASTSTLLDLVFRLRIAEHFTSQAQRIHFMGSLQGFLCLRALFSQFAVRPYGRSMVKVLSHPPSILTAPALASV